MLHGEKTLAGIFCSFWSRGCGNHCFDSIWFHDSLGCSCPLLGGFIIVSHILDFDFKLLVTVILPEYQAVCRLLVSLDTDFRIFHDGPITQVTCVPFALRSLRSADKV